MQSNESSEVNENNNVKSDGSKDSIGMGYDRYSDDMDEVSKCESVEFRLSGVSKFQKTLSGHNERRSSLRRNVSKGNLMSSDHTESKVLVIYTGGTIGMMRNENNGECNIICVSILLLFVRCASLIELLFVLQTVCLHSLLTLI